MPEFKKAYVTVMVADLDKAVDFYTNVLGLYEDLRFGDSWAEMVAEGLTVGLHPKKPRPSRAQGKPRVHRVRGEGYPRRGQGNGGQGRAVPVPGERGEHPGVLQGSRR